MLSKTFKVLIKWTVIGKKCLAKLFALDMVYQRGLIQFIRFLSQNFVQAKFVTSQIRHSLLSTAVYPKFLTKIFFLKNFRPFKKYWIALPVSINQYCHTVPF